MDSIDVHTLNCHGEFFGHLQILLRWLFWSNRTPFRVDAFERNMES